MPTRPELAAAYRATAYRIFLPDGVCDLRIDVAAAPLAAWLEINGYDRFAIITAYNPQGRLASLTVNRENQQKLLARVVQAGWPWLAGCNLADAGDWPEEPTLLLAGMSEAEGTAWGQAFGQNAVVVGDAQAIPRLVWV